MEPSAIISLIHSTDLSYIYYDWLEWIWLQLCGQTEDNKYNFQPPHLFLYTITTPMLDNLS